MYSSSLVLEPYIILKSQQIILRTRINFFQVFFESLVLTSDSVFWQRLAKDIYPVPLKDTSEHFWDLPLELVIYHSRTTKNECIQPPYILSVWARSHFLLLFSKFIVSPQYLPKSNMFPTSHPFHLEKNDKNGSAWDFNLLNFLNVNKSLFLPPLPPHLFLCLFCNRAIYWTFCKNPISAADQKLNSHSASWFVV